MSKQYLLGTDELGRELPGYNQVSKLRTDKYVGIFYLLWAGQHGSEGPYDISKILNKYPEAVYDDKHHAWGPWGAYHHWGEPLFGYYLADDTWVLRRHIQLLTLAGIDFLVLDATNGWTYKNIYDLLYPILDELRSEGWDVPKCVHYTNTDSSKLVEMLYEDIYKPGRFSDSWFIYKGKPMIIGDPEGCSEEVQQFFTFRLNQWPWLNEPQKINGFPWIEFCRPQRVFYNDEGEKEIISVSIAQHHHGGLSDTPFYNIGGNWGRSYHNGYNDTSPDAVKWGYNVAEQWEFALAEDPKIIHITGWNEWIAMRLAGGPEIPVRFVDQATIDFSRDIEPMKGGFSDCYYMQMINYIRRFKGMVPQPDAGIKHTISIEGSFNQWTEIKPEYRDFTNDTVHRHHSGYGGITYDNTTGRNDFDILKVARDNNFIYFYARTVQPITPHTDRNWMMLFLNIGDDRLSWQGYNFVINHTVIDSVTTWLERSSGGWNWDKVSPIRYKVDGNEMHFAIPRQLIGFGNLEMPIKLQFKWVDNMQNDGDIMDFYVNGDAAPDGRLNYVYQE